MSKSSTSLTPKQREVVDRLREGWELGVSKSLDRQRVWIQKNGVGRGGESVDLRPRTFEALKSAGLLVPSKSKYPTYAYVLVGDPRAVVELSHE